METLENRQTEKDSHPSIEAVFQVPKMVFKLNKTDFEMNRPQRDPITTLPRDMAFHILTFFEPRELAQLAKICKKWREISNQSLLWEYLSKAKSPPETNLFSDFLLTVSHPSHQPLGSPFASKTVVQIFSW